ncbi:SHOCT domain-containing protein [Sphingobium sp. AN641]|uniref:SHOCT domain-containing protein n=1 Tax=Sphingobium sp. AN641 TaxID=3133443 RepID=UPI0030BA9585
MEDRFANLERLARLRDEGMLTAEEFAAEKARLLGSAGANGAQVASERLEQAEESVVHPGSVAERHGLRSGRTALAIVLVIAAALTAAGGAYFYGRDAAPAPALPSPSPVVRNDAPVAITPPAQPVPAALLLDGDIKFSDPANCKASKGTEALFSNVLVPPNGDVANIRSKPIRVGPDQIKIKPIFKKSSDEDMVAYEGVAEFPQPATWHGLKVRGVTATLDVVPESDSTYSRQIRFSEAPDTLRAALNKLGFAIPPSPDYANLTDDACGGSMQIIAIPGGSALQCSWGC